MMSQHCASHDRTPVGAQGDRRQQPTATKTKGGIKPEVRIVRKRSCEKTKADEEEWNQRMQIWEKKKKRLSGSEWDKSFREAVRSRLKGKKPWITPITCPKKLSPRRIGSSAHSPGNSENFSSNTIDLMNPNNEDHWEQESVQSTSMSKEDEKEGKTLLEAVGLKRECSRIELDVTAVVQSDRSTQGALSEKLRVFKNKLLKSSDSMMAKIKASEKVEDIILERTDSIVMVGPSNITQSSTRFVKTILSPIQSEGECSQQGADAASSDDKNRETISDENPGSPETIMIDQCSVSVPINNDEQRWRNTLAEKSEQCLLSEHTMSKKNLEELEMNMQKETFSPHNSKDLLHSKANFSHKSKNVLDISENIEGLQTKPDESKSEREEYNATGADQGTIDNDSWADRITPEMVKQIKEILERGRAQQPVKTKEVRKPKMNTAKKESKKNVESEMKPSSPSKTKSSVNIARQETQLNEEPLMKIPWELKDENVTLLNRLNVTQMIKNEKLDTIQRGNVEHVNLVGRDVQSLTKCSIDKTDENWIANHNTVSSSDKTTTTVRALNISPTILKGNNGDDRKFIETACNRSSEKFMTTNHATERALHAIFTSPDTEIFGNWKKPLAQPVFIASMTFEDSSLDLRRVSDADTRLVFAEGVPNELYELRARARPHSDESLILVDRSLEDLTDTSRDWYREFDRPAVSSCEVSEPEQMKSECFREIIIDRSGCRSSYDGPCYFKISENHDDYHLRRYEVCHDASKCSLKNLRKVTTTQPLR